MIIKETQTEPMPVSINGQPPQSMSQRLVTHKVATDEDMVAFHEEMTKGRDILVSVEGNEATYVMTRQLIPSKIALPGTPKGIER